MRLATWALCVAMLCVRGWHRIVRAQLWAEDGALFLSDAYLKGTRALFEPYGGYQHLGPRLVALAARSVPVRWAPTFIVVVCVLLAGWVFSEPVRLSSARPWKRALLCAALCFVPGLHEVAYNLANLHSLAFLWLALLGARGGPLHAAETALACVAAFTAGESVLLLPLFLLRREWLVTAALLGAFAVNTLASHATSALPPLLPALTAYGHTLVYGLGLGPLIGAKLTADLWSTGAALYTLCAVPALAVLAIAAARASRGPARFFVLAVLCAAALPALTYLVRPVSIHVLEHGPSLGYTWSRYAFQLAPLGVLAWAAVLARLRVPLAAYAVLFVVLSADHWRIGALDAPRWPAALRKACNEAGDPVSIPSAPEGWHTNLPRARACAP